MGQRIRSVPARRRDARALVQTIESMAMEGRPLMMRVLPPDAPAVAWDHYPDDDARDPASGCRYYYHVHGQGDRPVDEHGHFHLFLPRSLFPGLTPMASPPHHDPERPELVHVAGLAIDHQGLPLRWFATNRHVTDEFLFPAIAVSERIPKFRLGETGEDPLVDRFLMLMVQLFAEELRSLLVERDARLLDLAARRGGRMPTERGYEVLGVTPIDLDQQILPLLGRCT